MDSKKKAGNNRLLESRRGYEERQPGLSPILHLEVLGVGSSCTAKSRPVNILKYILHLVAGPSTRPSGMKCMTLKNRITKPCTC